MSQTISDAGELLTLASQVVHRQGLEIQSSGHVIRMPIALAESACKQSFDILNQVLADVMTLRDLYQKHHWQVSGPALYQLHLLFDKHHAEQATLIETVAERAQTTRGREHRDGGGRRRDNPHSEAAQGLESALGQLSRLLHAHEIIPGEARAMARLASECGDDGTNDVLVSDVSRTNELQVWFVAEHAAGSSAARAE